MAKSSNQKINNPTGTTTSDDNNTTTNAAIVKTKRKRNTIPRDSPQQRSSIYRGVTRHRWTGRYEAHLWDKNCWNQAQSKKGRQVYLGAYDEAAAAAHAYDLAALKYWGQQDTILNFPISTYEEELKEMDCQTKEEYIGSLRRKSSGFSRGVSKYRGVARHHHNGRWEARIGRVFGNKYLYLGTYATQEEAATAYDMAAIEYRGINAVTNFDLSHYVKWIRPLQNSSNSSESVPNDSNGVETTQNPKQETGLTFLNFDQESRRPDDQIPSSDGGSTTPSALGLLLQSSKFKEMLKQVRDCSSPSSSSEADPPRSCFPDDIQTSFDIQDASSFANEHDIVFNDYNSLMSPMFLSELDPQ